MGPRPRRTPGRALGECLDAISTVRDQWEVATNFLSELVDGAARTERVLASTTSYLLEPRDVSASLDAAGFDLVDEHVPAPGMGPIVTAIKK